MIDWPPRICWCVGEEMTWTSSDHALARKVAQHHTRKNRGLKEIHRDGRTIHAALNSLEKRWDRNVITKERNLTCNWAPSKHEDVNSQVLFTIASSTHVLCFLVGSQAHSWQWRAVHSWIDGILVLNSNFHWKFSGSSGSAWNGTYRRVANPLLALSCCNRETPNSCLLVLHRQLPKRCRGQDILHSQCNTDQPLPYRPSQPRVECM